MRGFNEMMDTYVYIGVLCKGHCLILDECLGQMGFSGMQRHKGICGGILVDSNLLWKGQLMCYCFMVEYWMSVWERCVCRSGFMEPPDHPGSISLI